MKLKLITLMIILLISPATATTGAGMITPDSPLWTVDIAAERFMEMLAFKADKRVELQLQHADERIAEMQVSDNPEVATEYNKVMNRIQQAEGLQYETTQLVQNRIQQHTDVLGQINSMASNEAKQIALQTQEHVATMQHSRVTEQQTWWADEVTMYPVPSVPVSLSSIFNAKMDQVKSFVPNGTTQITVTDDAGNVINNYIVSKNDDVTIAQGVTTNADHSFTFTIEQVQEYKKQCGGMLGL